MPARAMWKGVISVSDLSLPVKLYPSVKDTRVHFRLLHKRSGVPLEQVWVCAAEERPVPSDEIVKGVEVEDGKFVLVEPEELRSLEPESSRTIEVHSFVKDEEVDPRFYERPYYIGPDGTDALFASMVDALTETGRVGVCEWVMHKRDHIGVLKPHGKALALVTLRYRDEVIAIEDLEIPAVRLSERELKTAGYLIQELTDTFDPAAYKDEHQERLRALVEAKARGRKPKIRRSKDRRPTAAPDLLDVLEASLSAARRGSGSQEGVRRGARGARGTA